MDIADSERSSDHLPIIAVGASAGGLDPIEAFFDAAPLDTGWCFVVIQHLSPDYRSMMDELLGRRSSLAIQHIREGLTIAPNTIFLNPPNAIVELQGDRFRLTPYREHDKLPHLPIDAFFHSMATRGRGKNVAVVLSGSGADGARGAAEIHRNGGFVFVQTPSAAKFTSMPRAVLAMGAVDRVLEAGEMPAAITDILERGGDAGDPVKALASHDPGAAILHLIERAHHIDFSAYKAPTVMRRIERRQSLRGIDTLEQYSNLLASDPEAVEELYHDLLIGVTEFYRDPDAIASLSRQALIPLVTSSLPNEELRVWVPACASGEEAYTIAIELAEAVRSLGAKRHFRIIATDVHRPSVERAATGVYPPEALEKLPDVLRERYFVDHRQGMLVDPALRQTVIFSVQDALRDPPFMRLDLVSCRNLLIYLDDDAQARLLSRFLFGLRKDGYLFLGPSETLGGYRDEFVPIDSKWRLFRKSTDRKMVDHHLLTGHIGSSYAAERQEGRARRPSRPPLVAIDQSQPVRHDRDSLLRGYDALLKRYAPSSILISEDGTVLTWFGAASAYVDTMSNLADWTVEDIVHPALHYAINVGVERVRQGQDSAYQRDVDVVLDGDEHHRLQVRIEPLGGRTDAGRFLLVSLTRAETAAEPSEPEAAEQPDEDKDRALLSMRIRELERDLRLTEESLQYVTERLEASGEELQASNEELQASNEELQASNEELQSSNEELNAVNEELISVSAEHERKIELLSQLSRDTDIVFELLELGVIIADAELRLKRFTKLCGQVLELEERDIGRHLRSVGARPEFADPASLAAEAVRTGLPQEASGAFRNGDLHIRVTPFEDGVADSVRGVIVTLSGSTMTMNARQSRRVAP